MRLVILMSCAALCLSCTTSKAVIVKKEVKKPAPVSVKAPARNTGSRSEVSLQYIEQYKGIAIEEMLKAGIPASITLAQGLLESASGTSELAIEANNHFGIKCNSSWTGPTTHKDDDAKGECFRVYENAEQSYRDHSEFLKRARYVSLFQLERNDYRGWAYGLKQAGYATNPKYAELLIGLIERYNLDQYDREEKNPLAQGQREEKVIAEIIKEEPKKPVTEAEKLPLAMRIYEVKKGDTLYTLSKRFGLTVEEIKALNSLDDTALKLGQLLLVSK